MFTDLYIYVSADIQNLSEHEAEVSADDGTALQLGAETEDLLGVKGRPATDCDRDLASTASVQHFSSVPTRGKERSDAMI